jgi:two-component system chemotaxis response regulator CheY
MNLLIVEDEATNVKLLDHYVMSYFKDNNIIDNINIDIASNGYEAIGMYSMHQYDIILLDVKMPKCDGIKVLNYFKSNSNIDKPFICMITAMGESKYKNLYKLLGANSYIIKPFDKMKIYQVLDKILEVQDDDMLEFNDMMEFDEADEFDEFRSQKENLVQTHAKVSSVEFLKDYDDISYMVEDIDDIDDIIQDIILRLDILNLDTNRDDILLAFHRYIRFLNSLFSFGEISDALGILSTHISNLKLESYDELNANFIIELIRAILDDLSTWKNYVFVEQSVNDVYYINDSILSNCKQFENIIK